MTITISDQYSARIVLYTRYGLADLAALSPGSAGTVGAGGWPARLKVGRSQEMQWNLEIFKPAASSSPPAIPAIHSKRCRRWSRPWSRKDEEEEEEEEEQDEGEEE